MKSQRQSDVKREGLKIRRSLRTLDRSLLRLTPMLSAAVSLNPALKANGRSRPRFSAKARTSMILQGRYLGYMRQLKPRQKEEVRKIRKVKGVRAAIVSAKVLASGLGRAASRS